MASSAASSSSADHIRVAVRVKPLSDEERSQRIQTAVRVADSQVIVGAEKIFAFDHVYPQDVSTRRIYDSLIGPLISSAFLSGYNATVFAYGQTGAGKSFTMNTVTQMAVRQLFEYLRADEASTTDADRDETGASSSSAMQQPLVTLSMLELHNETLIDLLAPTTGGQQPLVIRDGDPERGVVVQNLQEYPVENEDDIARVLELGTANRSTAATLMNQHSSRSHMMVTIGLKIRGLTSKLNLVDLAGSERLKKSLGNLRATGNPSGGLGHAAASVDPNNAAAVANAAVTERMKEAISINSGLLALGNVISALCSRQAHVPYRTSKLTRILQDSLSGNCRTAMIACVSSADTNTEETLSTLKYANRAKALVTRAVQNVSVNPEEAAATISSLRHEVDTLRSALSRLQLQAVTGCSGDPSGGGFAPGGEAAAGSQLSRMLNQSRDAFLQVQSEATSLRKQLQDAMDELGKERRVTSVLQEDLFKAEYAAMAAKDALLAAKREIAELRGEDPSRITAGALTSFFDPSQSDYGAVRDANAPEDEDDDDDDDGSVRRIEAQRLANLNDLADTLRSRAGPGGGPQHHAAEEQASENDALVRRMRAELHDKEQQIKFLSDTCDFAENQMAEMEARLHSADSEVRRLEQGLHTALSKLEQTGMQSAKMETQRQQIIASYDARLQAEKSAAAEFRRRLNESRAEMKARQADRDRLRLLQQEAAALAEKVRLQQELQRRMENKSRAQHQQEVQHLHRALREAKAENRRVVTMLRKKDEEFQTRIAMLQREGVSRHHQRFAFFPANEDERAAGGHQTPRGGVFGGGGVFNHRSDSFVGPTHSAPPPSDEAPTTQHGAHADPKRPQLGGNRLMHPTASSRARANAPAVNVVSLAPATERSSAPQQQQQEKPGSPGPHHVGGTLPLIVNTSTAGGQHIRASAQGPARGGGAAPAEAAKHRPQSQLSPQEQHYAGSPPARSSQHHQPSAAEVAADALYKRLGELDALDRELSSIAEERDRRAAEFTKVNQSYSAHRMQRALEAWRYYAQQLEEKLGTCTDGGEREQLQVKSEDVARRIQALEQVIPCAQQQQQQELQSLDDAIDNLRVKRNVLLNIIRGLQEEAKAASVPRMRSRSRDEDVEGDSYDASGVGLNPRSSFHQDPAVERRQAAEPTRPQQQQQQQPPRPTFAGATPSAMVPPLRPVPVAGRFSSRPASRSNTPRDGSQLE